jgi:multiple sugar transport system ATP-binding protein
MPLPGRLAAATRRHRGESLVVGVRPEDVHWAREAPEDGLVCFAGVAEVVEPLGSETLVALAVNGERLVARLPPRSGIEPGDRIDLRLDPTHLHLFDPDSGVSLTLDE